MPSDNDDDCDELHIEISRYDLTIIPVHPLDGAHDLTYAVNSLVYATMADTEVARNIVKARLLRNE